MGTTTEILDLNADGFISSAEAAAAGIEDLAQHTKDAATEAKAAEQAFDAFAKSAEGAATTASKFKGRGGSFVGNEDWRKLGKNQDKATGKTNKLADAFKQLASGEHQRMFDSMGKGMGKLGKAGGVAAAGVSGAAIAVGAFVAVIGGIAAVATPFMKAAGAANIARDGFRAALDQVTGGRGEEAVAVLDKLAKGLNMPVEKLTDQFIALRKQGINNIDSENLIKLRADLVAVGVDAKTADEAIKGAVESIKSGKDASAVIDDVANKFGAMGDGANASADSFYTLEGAMDRVKGGMERLGGRLADKSSESFDKLAQSVSGWWDKFEESGAAEAILDAITAGIDAVVEAAEGFMSVVEPALEGLKGPFEDLAEALGSTTDGSTAARDAGAGLGQIVSLLIGGVGLLVDAVTFAVEAWHAFRSAISWIADVANSAYSALLQLAQAVGLAEPTEAAAGWKAAGDNAAGAFVAALESQVGAAQAAGSKMGAAATAGVTSSLQISSPSKVAQRLAQNFGDSFTDTLGDSMPDDIAMAVPANGNGAGALEIAPVGSASAGSGGGPISLNVEVNVTQTDASVDDIRLAVQEGAEQALRLAGVA
jgi:hypothetical protein